jgi:hypothetical protein
MTEKLEMHEQLRQAIRGVMFDGSTVKQLTPEQAVQVVSTLVSEAANLAGQVNAQVFAAGDMAVPIERAQEIQAQAIATLFLVVSREASALWDGPGTGKPN